MSASIGAQGLDVDELGHIVVVLNDAPSDQWMEAFREYWADTGSVTGSAVKTDAFSHFSGMTIVFRGVDVDGFVAYCKAFIKDAIKFANERTQRFETERDDRIRDRAETGARDQKNIEAEKAKARKVKFD